MKSSQSTRPMLLSITFLCFIEILVAGSSVKDYWEAGVKKNNELRALHNTPLLKLDTELAEIADKCAQYYADKGIIDHTCPYRGDWGINGECLWMGNPHQCVGEVEVVNAAYQRFYDEITDYDFEKHGPKKGKIAWNVGHFTQIIWESSKRLGTGYAQGKNKQCYVVAIHSPPGNYPGQDRDMVLPPRGNVSSKETCNCCSACSRK